MPESHPPSPSPGEAPNAWRSSALHRAIDAASSAFPEWRDTPVQVRQRLLLEYAHELHKVDVREEVAQLSA